MPTFLVNILMKELRKRRKLFQQHILGYYKSSEAMVSRIENNHQKPREHTVDMFIGSMGIPAKSIFVPYLDDQPMYAHEMRNEILFLLDRELIEPAEPLIEELESMEGFDKGINLQFLLQCKSRIAYMRNDSEDEIISMILRAIVITYDNFIADEFKGALLISGEIELVYTLACTYERKGNMYESINLLEDIRKGLVALPEDDKNKEKYLPQILLTISDFLIKSHKFKEAWENCEKGIYVSLIRTFGSELPALFYNKAYCLLKIGKISLCDSILHQSYFGYTMLHEKEKADKVIEKAKIIFGITINTFGTENISYNLHSKYFPTISLMG